MYIIKNGINILLNSKAGSSACNWPKCGTAPFKSFIRSTVHWPVYWHRWNEDSVSIDFRIFCIKRERANIFSMKILLRPLKYNRKRHRCYAPFKPFHLFISKRHANFDDFVFLTKKKWTKVSRGVSFFPSCLSCLNTMTLVRGQLGWRWESSYFQRPPHLFVYMC